ncbi:MAG: rhomboid family intramembrane serine protease [Bdellovibrionaceae bacterium]|nr:rhomboid family intramembrane serine protease [Pseudobdellovibrionaceae bacterium]
MRHSGRRGGGHSGSSGVMVVQMTPVVKILLIANIAIWLGVVHMLPFLMSQLASSVEWAGAITRSSLFQWVGLVPYSTVFEFKLWQPLTYLFLHSPDLTHILFNMLLLWWVGSQIERTMGTKQFLRYYLVCGVGAGILYLVSAFFMTSILGMGQDVMTMPVVGASGAIFGLLLAFAIFHGEEVVYFMMIFPMRAKYFVAILALIEVFMITTLGVSGPVANLAHLGGFIVGFAYLWFQTYLKRRAKRRWFRKNGRNLRLVVDNEKKSKTTYH